MSSYSFDIHRNLVEESKRFNEKAQFELYNLYAKAMYNTCYRIMGHRESAEDMLQEAFTEAFQRLDSFRYESTFGAWLKRISINKCLNELKRRKADLTFSDNLEMYHPTEKEDNDASLPELSVEKLNKAMSQLPKGNRLIFQLYLLEGYDHREIAEILNVSESNSKSQYMRAKRKIKELLKDTLYE